MFEVCISNWGFDYNYSFVRLSSTYLKAEISTTAKRVQLSRRLYSCKMACCQQSFFGIKNNERTIFGLSDRSYLIIAELFLFHLRLGKYIHSSHATSLVQKKSINQNDRNNQSTVILAL